MKKLTIRLDESIHGDLKILCASHNMSIQQFIEEYIKKAIEEETKKIQEDNKIEYNLKQAIKEMKLIKSGNIKAYTREEIWDD